MTDETIEQHYEVVQEARERRGILVEESFAEFQATVRAMIRCGALRNYKKQIREARRFLTGGRQKQRQNWPKGK